MEEPVRVATGFPPLDRTPGRRRLPDPVGEDCAPAGWPAVMLVVPNRESRKRCGDGGPRREQTHLRDDLRREGRAARIVEM